ncbi:MAG: amidohydrolase family protein [Myxococcota bacterium]|jgi:predicted TIM-barrel fold metal-dependent hydrolase
MFRPADMGKAVRCAAVVAVIMSACSCTQERSVDDRFRRALEQGQAQSRVPFKIDMHSHISHAGFDHAISLMDKNGIAMAVNMSAGTPGNGLETAMVLAHLSSDRIINFTTIDWDYIDDPAKFAAGNTRDMRRAKQLGARGLKVHKALGLGVTLADGSLLKIDDPRLDPIWREAGALGLPVMIHVADPVAFFEPPIPSNERYAELSVHPDWSFSDPPYPKFAELLAGLESIVARHPGTTFIGVHFGNYAENPQFVGRMLDSCPNYFIDTAARVPEFGRHNARAMRDFFIKYQDRIVFGTDIGISRHDLMLGSGDGLEKNDGDAARFYDAHWSYFEGRGKQIETPTPIQGNWKIDAIDLPTPVLEKLYYKNARKLLGIKISR